MDTLQLGMGWFNEQPGWLDRVHFELLPHLPWADIEAQGLMAGDTAAAEQASSQEGRGRLRREMAAITAGFRPQQLLAAHFTWKDV